MKLGESGEAFFVEELVDENDIPEHLATSPIPVEFEDMLKHQVGSIVPFRYTLLTSVLKFRAEEGAWTWRAASCLI